MAEKYTFFPVGDGDMGLVELASGKKIIIDVRIRVTADNPDDETPDVASQLRARLSKDADGRYYADAMILSHPDEDHCQGLEKHFHLGPIADFPKGSDKILVHEMWSSPIVFRRASKSHTLCDDAKYWNKEAKRRVNQYRANGVFVENERILVIGEDEDGKTDDIGAIVKKIDETITAINGVAEPDFAARVIGPLPIGDEEEEEQLSKNDSSIILRFQTGAKKTRYLTGGDAEVAVWEKVYARNKGNLDNLAYDLLLTPHHCSWHSLSWDSWSKKKEEAVVSDDARSALSQAQDKARLIASSKPITDEDADPPCVRAEREYKAIADDCDGEFFCVGDSSPEPLEFEVGDDGLQVVKAKVAKAEAFKANIAKVAYFDRQPHKQRPTWPLVKIGKVEIVATASRNGFRPVVIANDAQPLTSGTSLEFEAEVYGIVGKCQYYWQVVNTGQEAANLNHLRGGFEEYEPVRGKASKSETARYRGTHSIECFIVQNGRCVASSGPFIVNVA